MQRIICHIGIGSNIGDALQNCQRAVEEICHIETVSLIAHSSFYRTEPIGDIDQDYFVNAAVEIATTLQARELLKALEAVERKMGRVRMLKGGPRIIDLDILFYGQAVINEGDLVIPHPELHRRRFVLAPLCEIASYVIHPVYGVSVRGLLDRLEDDKSVTKIE
ncbi:MAG TPA: 2-amino-4-hydroxy-6-hydroxymethyldihydropteridine diphosphokinase [Smithellaceae bacterium]|nr:2-amino-4-hydroxy-6-hydroxymethyldihydropteridine diphosphokinase [Smithellaceae bacterium]HRS89977.1 2-amino-4-hydroxy-6-hydroxymethyldihydropteridine diphosphokinase [Smithellaceae bacterium]HRV25871.1 2-amino-4-hydroxy-6-hydroxymethyldihydropteridine diphosphokinase [Smithellaceae bacterium]